MAEVDAELARHCLEGIGSVNTRSCPIIEERTRAAKECDGLAPTDRLFEFAVQAIVEASAEKGKARAKLLGQIDALCYAVALIRNPYRVDMESVYRQANEEAAARLDE